MTCAANRDLMPDYLLGLLDPGEEAVIRAHLDAGCPACAAALAEAETTLAALPLALPAVTPDPALRAKVLGRIAQEAAPVKFPTPRAVVTAPRLTTPAPAPIPFPTRPSRLPWMVTAAAILLAAGAWWAQLETSAVHERDTAALADARERETAAATAALADTKAHADALAIEVQRLTAVADGALADNATASASTAAMVGQIAAAQARIESAQKDAALATARLSEAQERLATDSASAGATTTDAIAQIAAAQKRLADAQSDHDADKVRLAKLQDQLDDAQQAISALRAANVKLVSLAAAGPQPAGAHARILWDQDRGTWYFVATGMAKPAAGRTFEMWFVTADKQKLPVGTFDADAAGNVLCSMIVPANAGPLALAAVTDEPAGGVKVPSGAFQLTGTL